LTGNLADCRNIEKQVVNYYENDIDTGQDYAQKDHYPGSAIPGSGRTSKKYIRQPANTLCSYKTGNNKKGRSHNPGLASKAVQNSRINKSSDQQKNSCRKQ
jgi:hypothetical protein